MEYNSEFLDNIEFLIMCRNVISSQHKLGGSLVRQQGFLTASLETYLDFWFNCLPISTDRKCRPICAVSTDGCYVCDDNHSLIKAELNAPVKDVVNKFLKCRKRNKSAHDNPTLNQVVRFLQDSISDNSNHQHDLIGWAQYYMPAKISVLELKNKTLEKENSVLRAVLANSEEKITSELSRYSETFREGETSFNNHIESCNRHIELYRDFLINLMTVQTVDLYHEPDKSAIVKMAKDAIQYYKHRKQRMLKVLFRDVPAQLTDLPIGVINEVCGTKLDMN